jgi:hypothetical protein
MVFSIRSGVRVLRLTGCASQTVPSHDPSFIQTSKRPREKWRDRLHCMPVSSRRGKKGNRMFYFRALAVVEVKASYYSKVRIKHGTVEKSSFAHVSRPPPSLEKGSEPAS